MRIGLFGGTFDPVHYGHLRPVERIREELHLDRVLYIPNRRSPFAEKREPVDARHRVAMLALALSGKPFASISLLELDRPQPSYAADTVDQIAGANPDDQLFFLLGTDALAGFARWHRPHEIVRKATLAAFVREPFDRENVLSIPDLAPFRGSILIFDPVRATISSSAMRRARELGESISSLTPPAVEEYIVKQGLYQKAGAPQS